MPELRVNSQQKALVKRRADDCCEYCWSQEAYSPDTFSWLFESKIMYKLPFKQRFGVGLSKPIEQDFPEGGRVALAYLIDEMRGMTSIRGYNADPMINEMLRTARLTYADFDFDMNSSVFDKTVTILRRMEWWQVYTFCERLYEKHIDAAGYTEEDSFIETQSKAEVQNYFKAELNNILNEENVSYQFINDQLQHRGRHKRKKAYNVLALS